MTSHPAPRANQEHVRPADPTTQIYESGPGAADNPRRSGGGAACLHVNRFDIETSNVVISVVIPARNEERFIERTLQSIHESLCNRFTYEIIVVDNGSSDSTAAISVSHGASLISQNEGTIGSLRNTGARHARGEIIVFLDADVVLTEKWARRISATVELLGTEPKVITGSLCDVPQNASWIERTWFAPRDGRYLSHIGTGHMIVSRPLFDLLGGFDESLATGEDYDISARARLLGARIVIDQLLRVEHMGFPTTLRAFIRREIWHGTSDFRSFADVVRSKVAIAALIVAVLHGIFLVGLLTDVPIIAVLAAGAIGLLCVSSSAWRYRRRQVHVIALNSILYYFYYVARSLAALRLWTRADRR